MSNIQNLTGKLLIFFSWCFLCMYKDVNQHILAYTTVSAIESLFEKLSVSVMKTTQLINSSQGFSGRTARKEEGALKIAVVNDERRGPMRIFNIQITIYFFLHVLLKVNNSKRATKFFPTLPLFWECGNHGIHSTGK